MVAVTYLDWLTDPVEDEEEGLKNVVLCFCFRIVYLVDPTPMPMMEKKIYSLKCLLVEP